MLSVLLSFQLGYGCHANSAQLVAEGLAYLHMSHLTFRYTSGGAREADVDDVLDEVLTTA
jgi:hypothetical protein